MKTMTSEPGRNDPCPCGSGKKYKQCCMRQEQARAAGGSQESNLLQAGMAHHRAGRLSQAEAAYRQVLQANPAHPGALHWMGVIAGQGGKREAAVELIGKSIASQPADPVTHNSLGIVLREQGRLEEAVASYRRALVLKPDFALAHCNLGNALTEKGDMEEAVASYRKAIDLKPDFAEAHCNMGKALLDLNEPAAAMACFQRACRIRPDFAEAHYYLGLACKNQGQLDVAAKCYRKALSFRPDYVEAHNDLGITMLLRGEFREGWREYEWRVKHLFGSDYIADPRNSAREMPRPSALLPLELSGRRMLLIPDQGIGDEIFFLRFAQVARQRGAWVAYIPSAKIASIVQRAPGLDMVAVGAGIPPDLDHVFLVGDLPLVLGMSRREDIPPPLPLSCLPERVAAIKGRLAALGHAPFLGVTWRAGVERSIGSRKTLFKEVGISALGKLLSGWPGEVLILQRNPGAEEKAEFERALGRPAHDLSRLNDDLEDMLALLSLLDEYVGVSNTNMHLMAGLGKTARVLIPQPPDWRWMDSGEESPWFPGFRLYRETREGGWDEAYARLAQDLCGARA